jgi:hypothetical protein
MKDLRNLIVELRTVLGGIEGKLATEDPNSRVLEEFKSSLDSARTVLLAIIGSTEAGQGEGVVQHFRLRRASQVCQNVLFGILDKTIRRGTPGFAQMQETVNETLERLESVPDEDS